MNFLAHLYLSGESEELKIGNFIADTVKGKQYNNFPEGIKNGILLHRKIDSYTDSHTTPFKSKTRLIPHYKKYSGVLVDIFYDHFLALHWERYSPTPLNVFADETYALMQQNNHLLPEKSQFMLPYIIKGNWLVNYQHFEGIDRTLKGMARRAKFESGMENGVLHLKEYYEDFESEFFEFFEELRDYVKGQEEFRNG